MVLALVWSTSDSGQRTGGCGTTARSGDTKLAPAEGLWRDSGLWPCDWRGRLSRKEQTEARLPVPLAPLVDLVKVTFLSTPSSPGTVRPATKAADHLVLQQGPVSVTYVPGLEIPAKLPHALERPPASETCSSTKQVKGAPEHLTKERTME